MGKMIDRCAISESRKHLLEQGISELVGNEYPTAMSQENKVEQLKDILSLYLEDQESNPVMNYFLSTRFENDEVIELDTSRHHELVFLFLNYENMKTGFTKSFETEIRNKISPSGSNLPQDNITVSVFYLNNESVTIAQIKDRLRENKDLLGIYIFDFGVDSNQTPNKIDELELCSGFTIEDLLSNVERGGRKIMLGLFSQRVQDIIFKPHDLLEAFMEKSCSENIATMVLPACKKPIEQRMMMELAGLIEFLKYIFNSPDDYRKAVIMAQEGVKGRVATHIGDYTEAELENIARACTIFFGYEHQKIQFHGSRETSYFIEMRDKHKTFIRQLDVEIQNIEDDEGGYFFEECNDIAHHISKFVFEALYGLNVLIQFLGTSDNHQRFKKFIFSIVMSLQYDFFDDEKKRKGLKEQIVRDNWERFNAQEDANLIGKEVYSRLNEQTTEIAFLRGVERGVSDMLKTTNLSGSSLIFEFLSEGHSSIDTLNQLKQFLQNNPGNTIPLVHQRMITPILYFLETGIVENLLKIYFQCRYVTHRPSLTRQLPITRRYSYLFWSKNDKLELNRDHLQKSLSKVNEAATKLKREGFSYLEVPANDVEDRLDWFKEVNS